MSDCLASYLPIQDTPTQEYPFESSYSLNMLQLMRTLNTRARTSKLHGSIWQLSIATAHLKEIAAGSAQDLERFKKWEAVKRCKPLDGIVVSRDAVKTAVSPQAQCKWKNLTQSLHNSVYGWLSRSGTMSLNHPELCFWSRYKHICSGDAHR